MTCYQVFKDKVLTSLQELKGVASEDLLSMFCFYEDASNGILGFACDTKNNSLLKAKRKARRIVREMNEAKFRSDYRRVLQDYLRSEGHRLYDYNNSFSDMKSILCREFFPDLTNCESEPVFELYSIAEQVVESNLLDGLGLTSPCRIAIQSWESNDLWVTHILNWPEHQGERV